MTAAAAFTLNAPLLAPADRWLSQAEVLAFTGWNPRTIRKKIGSGELISRLTETRERNGKAARVFLAASLPLAAQQKLTASLAEQQRRSTQPAPLFAALQLAPPAGQRARILSPASPEAQVAHDRLSKIQPLLAYDADPVRWHHLLLADGTPVRSKNGLTAYLSQLHGVSERTLWRWVDRAGSAGLADRVRSDKGQSRWFARRPEARQLVESVYLKPYQTVQTAYDNLCRARVLLGIAPDDLPSYETVRKHLETIPKPLSVMARQGERAFHERMSPYLAKDYESVAVNQFWVADHMVSDMFVVNDLFESVPAMARMRLRFSAFLDMRTRKFMGYCWAPEGNSRVIATAIRRGVERYGLPGAIYCDNGADYKKVARFADPVAEKTWREQEFQSLEKAGALHALGVPVQFCLPFHPQSKNIERAFGTFHRFEALFPHYTSGTTQGRPDQTVIAMGDHAKFLKHGGKSPLIPASLYIQMATTWIEQDYNAGHHHRGHGMDGRTPDEVFATGWSEQTMRRADPAVLAQLLFERQTRRVRECAIVLGKHRYVATDAIGSAQMFLLNEREALVCYDPHDLDRAVVCDLDGHQIATVQRERLAPHSAAAQPAIAASMQERKRLRNATVSTVKQIHHSVAMMGHKSDLELLLERSQQQPFTVGEHIVHRPADSAADIGPAQLHSEDIGNRLAARLAARSK